MPIVDPLDAAIRSISETRHLLALVVTSSESFDYHKAKAALGDLQLKLRELGRLQARLENTRPAEAPGVIPLRLLK